MAELRLGVDVEVSGAKELDKVVESLGDTGENLEGIAESVDKATDKTASLGDSLRGVDDLARGISDAFRGIGDIASGDFSGIGDVISGGLDIGAGAIESLDAIKNGALTAATEMASSVGKQIAQWVLLGTQSLIHGAKVAAAWLLALGPIGLLIAAVAAVVAIIILNWDKVLAFLKGVFKAIGDALAALGQFIIDIWNGIMDFLGGIVRGVADIGKKLWEPIGKGFGAAIDFIKGIWNAFARWWNSIEISVPSIDLPIIGRVGGFTIGLPDLPMLAAGGIVTGPTLAVLGEKGPEAVIPLDRAGVGTNVTVNIHGNVEGDERRLPSQILRGLYVAGLSN